MVAVAELETTYIDGGWRDPAARRSVTNPADGWSVVGTVGYGGKGEAAAAADAAATAFPAWSGLPARARADILLDAGSRLAERADEIGRLLAREAGKRLPEAVGEVRFGARRVTREFTLPANGSYSAPALLVDVPDGTRLAGEEVSGPVAGVFRFSDEEEALRRANATEMGLAGYFYSRDVARAWRFAERLEVGIVGINHALPGVALAPMGGVKQSGLGREGSTLGLEEFQDVRYLSFGV